MSTFLLVAFAHFLALLSPGPDFFLIARTALAEGRARANWVCIGIAAGNAVFIALAFGGSRLLAQGSGLFVLLQVAGACYLGWLGQLFLRHAGRSTLPALGTGSTSDGRARACLRGLCSALLNPKNALFYVSLVAMLGPVRSPLRDVLYAVWMVAAVLAWDLVLAGAIGHPRFLRHFERALPWLERITGAVLLAMAAVFAAIALRPLA